MPAMVRAFAGDSTITRSRRPWREEEPDSPVPLAAKTPFAAALEAAALVAGRFFAAGAFFAAVFVVACFLVVGISSSTAPLSVGSSGGDTTAVSSANEAHWTGLADEAL